MDDAKLDSLFKNRKEKEKQQKDQYKKSSKDRLRKICSTKIRTTMIGALDIIEKYLSEHWESNSEGANELKQIYEKIRQEILDKGNTQIRNLETEFEQYDIEWLRYTLELIVKPRDKGE